jgi:hypothetical protein
MERVLKKVLTAAIAAAMALTTTGCLGRRGRNKNSEPNEFRGTDYTYDFIDYAIIRTYGEDGDGYLEIEPREIDATQFEDEADYIAVKKDIDIINPTYIQGAVNQNSTLKISKTTGLSNGDVIQISVKMPDGVKPNSDMNIETYDYVVEGLGEAEEVDLFSSDIVTFYATNDGNLYYNVHAPKTIMKEELSKNLRYNIQTNDAKIEANKTILNVTADMDEDFLVDNGYNSLTLYLAKHDMKATLTTEKVLTEIIDPIDYSFANMAGVEEALYNALYPEEPRLVKICNLQQTARQASAEPFKSVVYYFVNDDYGDPVYYYREVEIHYIDNMYVVPFVGNANTTNDAELKEGSEMLMDFTIERAVPEEVSQEDQVSPDQAVPDQAAPEQESPEQESPEQVPPEQASPDQTEQETAEQGENG